MKSFPTIAILLLAALGLSSCLKDECDATRTYIQFDPVYKSEGEIRTAVAPSSSRELKKPGKIYFYNGVLLINEYQEGIHVIDNSDPTNPQFLSFVAIPGNVDMAIKDDVLYADNFIDLVTLDISNPRNPAFIGRTKGVFPSLGFDTQRGHLVYYQEREVREKITCEQGWGNIFWGNDQVFVRETARSDFSNAVGGKVNFSSSAGSGGGIGTGGSLARFTIADNYLYTVSQHDLKVFDIHKLTSPNLVNTIGLGWGIETIFPYQDKLFIGSMSAMYIYDNSNPAEPKALGVFEHARACDPVYADGNYAYVTLRDGTECQNFSNQLDVVDISDPTKPTLAKTYPMHHPIGLSKAGKYLFLCEDDQGLKVFDASDWSKIADRLLAHQKGFQAYDVIAFDQVKVAMVIGADGLHQFDFSNPNKLRELSVLTVSKE